MCAKFELGKLTALKLLLYILENKMASQRKRKYGSITEPSEDALNESLKSLNDSSEQGTSTTEDEEEEQNYDGGTVSLYDRIHGHFTLPKVLTKIIETPHFQRLRLQRLLPQIILQVKKKQKSKQANPCTPPLTPTIGTCFAH